LNLDGLPTLNRLSLSLPLELRLEILRHLGTQSEIVNLAHLMLVCKEWRETLNESFWEAQATAIGVGRKKRGSTWLQCFIGAYTSRCLFCKATRGLRQFGFVKEEPRSCQVCRQCNSSYGGHKTLELRSITINYGLKAEDLTGFYRQRESQHYTLTVYYLLSDVLSVISGRKALESQKIDRLAAMFQGNQLSFIHSLKNARQKKHPFPMSFLPKLAEGLLQKEGTDVKPEQLQKLMHEVVACQTRFSTMHRDLETALGEEARDETLLTDVRQRLSERAAWSRISYPQEEFVYNLIARDHISVEAFVQIARAEFTAQTMMKKAQATAKEAQAMDGLMAYD
jgi:hypothetical protein